jgi:hypothetical protein
MQGLLDWALASVPDTHCNTTTESNIASILTPDFIVTSKILETRHTVTDGFTVEK